MLRLIRPRHRERGAVAVIVAVVAGAFVLTGVAALTIDAGSLYAERRVVQNGADAASLALAQICAKDIADPSCANTSYLEGLAGDNATDDNLTSIHSVCGSGPEGGSLGPCPVGTTLIDCTALSTSLPVNVNWVEVKTRTLSASSTPLMRRFFAGFGGDADDGKTVQACARAAWGPAATGTATLPFSFSACEWDHATGATPGPPVYGVETAIALNYASGKKPAPCADFNGHDFPGGFGWLDREPDCSVDIVPGDWAGSVTPDSNGVGGGECNDLIKLMVGEVVYLPVFDCVNSVQIYCTTDEHPTSKQWYHIAGLAAFHLTGVNVTGQLKDMAGVGGAAKAYCAKVSKDNKCLYGYFTEGLVPVGTIGGPTTPNFGAKVVQVAG